MCVKRLTFGLAAVTGLCCGRVSEAALRVVAYGGQQAPGMPAGWRFDDIGGAFGDPLIDATGRVAFTGSIRKPDGGLSSGIWSERPGPLTAIAREGDPAPGTASNFTSLAFATPRLKLTGAGHASFHKSGTGFEGFFTDRSGVLSAVVLEGQTSPAPEGGIMSNLDLSYLTDASGRLTLQSRVGNASTGDYNLFKEYPAGLGRYSKEGFPAGFEDYIFEQVTLSPFAFLAMNGPGQVLVRAQIDAPDKDGLTSLHMESSGFFGPAVIQGQLAPGTNAFFSSFSNATMNNSGQLVVEASLTGAGVNDDNRDGIWYGPPGALQILVREDMPAVGVPAGLEFHEVFSGDINPLPVINGAGKAAFEYGLRGVGVTTANDEAIWTGTPGNLSLVVREGDPAPSAGAGATFTFVSSRPMINAAGQVMFRAAYNAPGGPGAGIFAQDAAGVIQLIARVGQTIQVAPGDVRTINGLQFADTNSGNQDGRSSPLSDAGHIALLATFTGGTAAILVADGVASPFRAADFQEDHDVDNNDLVQWRANFGSSSGATHTHGNADFDGDVDGADFLVWQQQRGSGPLAMPSTTPVPEPGALALMAIGLTCCIRFRQ
jgi:hypothetical protein